MISGNNPAFLRALKVSFIRCIGALPLGKPERPKCKTNIESNYFFTDEISGAVIQRYLILSACLISFSLCLPLTRVLM
jgi:hypothetical protein